MSLSPIVRPFFLAVATLIPFLVSASPQTTLESFRSNKGNERTLLYATEISANHTQKTVTASGNVEVAHGNITLFADKIVYNQEKDEIVASGNVRLLDHKNNITFADSFTLSGDLKRGVTKKVKGILSDDSLFAANRISRKSGGINRFSQAIYTPCEVCRKKPDLDPTWSIKANHMTWDQEKEDIWYTDATLEVYGIPILYTPYLSHPAPTVKRRSGFLAPFAGGSSGNLGFVIGVPYYWVIDESKDLTITPVYTRENPLLMLDYRQAFCSGYWHFKTSMTQSKLKKGPENNEKVLRDFRGHVDTQGRFQLTNHWWFGFDIQRALDDTYLKKYRFLGLSHQNFLTSRVYTESIWERNYASIEGYAYQSLQRDDPTSGVPFIAPTANLNLLSKPIFWNGAFFFDGNFLNLQRRKGRGIKRLSGTVGWKAQWTAPFGLITNIKLQGRGDLYRITNFRKRDGVVYSGQRTRLMPTGLLEFKYPLYRDFDSGRFIIEPVANIVGTSKGSNQDRIPNEDSSIFELSDANLFSINRFSGFDRVDEWSRVNYGLKFAFYSKKHGNSELFFGRSHSLAKIPVDFHEAGLRSHVSDYVLRGNYEYQDFFNINSRLLLNKNSYVAKRNESTISVGKPILKLHAGYTRFPKLSDPTTAVEQLHYGASSQFTKHWNLSVDIARELGKKGGNLSHGGTLSYEDECFKFSTSVAKTFYQDRDYRPGVTVMFRFSFKNLGDVSISGNQLGLGHKPQARENSLETEEATPAAAPTP